MIKKSIFILMLMTAIGYVSAQSLRFEWEGTVYPEGATVTCTHVEEWGEMVEHMQVRNMTNAAIDVMIEKEHVSIVEGTENSFCWGGCYTPAIFVSPRPVSIEGGAVSNPDELSFHHLIDPTYSGDPDSFIVGTSVVRYYAYPGDNPSDRVSILVKFSYEPSNLSENAVTLGHAYPNPASSMVKFNYEIPATAQVEARIYNLLGQEVMREDINGLQGQVSFSVADLTDGIYFCNLMVNGRTLKTEKFVVKK